MKRKLLFALSVAIAMLIGAAAVIVLIAQGRMSDVLVRYPLAPGVLFEGQPPLNILNLKAIVGDAADDSAALARVVSYYDSHSDALADMFAEHNSSRLAALYGMYIVHLNSPYGVAPFTDSFLGFVHAPVSMCGTRTQALTQIAEAFGLEWRRYEWANGDHGWAEIKINGRWELFDANVNVWIDKSTDELLAGQPRNYRTFFSPMASNSMAGPPDVGNMILRQRMPGLGLFFVPPVTMIEWGNSEERAS